MTIHHVRAGVLDVGYRDTGPTQGPVVVLLHGFPYDVHAFDDVTPRLTAAGCRVITPWLRGFGPTRFLSAATPRSGQQAALGSDLCALLDALSIDQAVLAGFDWGGRAACIVSALWPERVRGLVTCGGYNIQDIAASVEPAAPANEHRHWYQYYFHGARGRAGLERNRHDLCRLLWSLWSPDWRFDEATFQRSAHAFDNPDFVDVVIHSYRHRFGLVAGDPALDDVETALALHPAITVPTVSIDGASDGVAAPGGTAHHAHRFSGVFVHQTLAAVGHNAPQEAPAKFATAVLSLCADPA